MLDRQSAQEDQIGKLRQGHSDLRVSLAKVTSDVDTLRIDADNQSDSQSAVDRQLADIKALNAQVAKQQALFASDLHDLNNSCDTRINSVKGDLARTDEGMKQANDRLLIVEMERLPQVETTIRNMQVYIDIQRDAITRIKDHEAKTDSQMLIN